MSRFPQAKPTRQPAIEWLFESEPNSIATSRAPGIGFGQSGEGYVRFALIENRHRIRQAVRGIRRALRDSGDA